MKFERSFTVPTSPKAVLDALGDVERLAGYLPGGLVDGRSRGNRFGGQFALQLGSASAPYSAIVAAPERDDDAGRAVVTVQGNDDQGDGTADVTATFTVASAEGGSKVEAVVEIALGGRLSDVEDAVAESYARNAIAQLRASLLAGAPQPAAAEPAAPEPAPTPAPPEPPAAAAAPEPEPAPASEAPSGDAAPAEPAAPTASPAPPAAATEPEPRAAAPEPAPASEAPSGDAAPAEPPAPTASSAAASAAGEGPAEKSPTFGGEPTASEDVPAEKSPTLGRADEPGAGETAPGEEPVEAEVLPAYDRPLEPAGESEPEPPSAPPASTPALQRDEPAAPDASEPGLHAPPPPTEAPEWQEPEPAAPAPPGDKPQRTESIAPPGYEERRLHRPSEEAPRKQRGSGGVIAFLRRLLKRG